MRSVPRKNAFRVVVKYRAGVAVRPACRWRSMAAMISASMPMPALARNQRSFAVPSPMVRNGRVRMRSSRTPVASTASFGIPRERAKTLALPPGTVASSGHLLAGPVDQHPVDDLVDHTVAAERHDEVELLLAGELAEEDAVALVGGDGDVEVELVGEGVDDDVDHSRGGRRGPRIDDEEAAHTASLVRRAAR